MAFLPRAAATAALPGAIVVPPLPGLRTRNKTPHRMVALGKRTVTQAKAESIAGFLLPTVSCCWLSLSRS